MPEKLPTEAEKGRKTAGGGTDPGPPGEGQKVLPEASGPAGRGRRSISGYREEKNRPLPSAFTGPETSKNEWIFFSLYGREKLFLVLRAKAEVKT